MNLIFIEQTSAYQRVWSISYPHSLFECSNCNQPSYMCFIDLDIFPPWLMKTLAMFITHSPRLAGNSLRWLLRKWTFMLMLQHKASKLSSDVSTISLQLADFVFPKNPSTAGTNAFHALFSTSVIKLEKFLHLMNFLICITSKTPAFHYHNLAQEMLYIWTESNHPPCYELWQIAS